MGRQRKQGISFADVKMAELEAVRSQRDWVKHNISDYRFSHREGPPRDDLVGLALSGGGVRSSTFHLGVLQAFAAEGIFPAIDYVSAVSGGGFVASWLCKWLSEVSYDKVVRDLTPSMETPEATRLYRLRQYSSYLTPRTGVFGSDNVLLIISYCLQLLLHLLVIILVCCLLLLCPRLIMLVLKNIYHSSALAKNDPPALNETNPAKK